MLPALIPCPYLKYLLITEMLLLPSIEQDCHPQLLNGPVKDFSTAQHGTPLFLALFSAYSWMNEISRNSDG